VKWEKHKILRNDWKKDLLVVDMVIIKHILEWGKFMRQTCDLQEGPQAWCNSSSRGAWVELLLQVGDPYLYFLVKFYDLICYWCEMWITERWILGERRKVCVMMPIFWIVFWMYVYSRWKVVVWIAKWWNYRWQRNYENCDLGCELAYI